MKFTLLVTYVVAALSLQSASAEDLIISPGSDGWNDIYEPDASQPVEIAKADPLRKKLFGLARPKLEKVAGKPILFNGSLKGAQLGAVSGSVRRQEWQPNCLP